MARTVELLADKLILTSDNPRTENPITILNEMKAGLTKNSRAITIVNRAHAIQYAITEASLEDSILIAGKGHEAFQIIGDQKIPFSDQDTAKHFLKFQWGKK
jgi:UDP-N-acetylmuramoyl-L-alanyl-D-glutamate--2,6-diaminopimelate ligase